jgi:hypothetical protein
VPVSFVIFLRSFTVCAALLVAACSDSRAKARAQLDPGHTSELRRDATRVYEEFLAKTGVDFIALKTTQWPESFKRFGPLRVGIYRDGVALALEGNASAEKGVHILPLQMNAISPTGRAKYERMGEGVYWYALGK